MGATCSCNDFNNDNNKEYYGFGSKHYNPEVNMIKKKNFHDYNKKDKMFYEKTAEYDKYIKGRLNIKNRDKDEPKEYMNGTVKVIVI